MPSRRDLKGGLSFAGRQHRLIDVRASAGDGHSEDHHQFSLMGWYASTMNLLRTEDPAQRERFRWLHSSLNGIHLGPSQRKKAVASGMRPGIPDVYLPCTRRDAEGRVVEAGLYIEMKAKAGGRLSKEQKEFIEHARREGYRIEVAYTWQQAARLVIEYLGLARHAPIYE